jgi:HPt (histidine-containing phosphotransfer) domain-containing protein
MLVNLVTLEEWANGDVGTMKEIIRIFVDNTPPTFALLQGAIDQQNWEGIGQHAHKLKSSYGIVVIGNSLQVIQEIEQLSKGQKDMDQIISKFGDIQRMYATALEEFDEFAAKNPG